MLCGLNGAADRWAPCWISVTMATTTSTSSSKPKKKPASRVETPTPRNIMNMAPAVNTSVKMIHGTLTLK